MSKFSRCYTTFPSAWASRMENIFWDFWFSTMDREILEADKTYKYSY